ncbi:MAG TPA: M55 family metallopeptidase [Actinomycetota bacterium]|nr:M55 family metallopeptidase [Actinomycetota bacterium]
MRVAVCADMEGLSGVDRYQQCFPGWTSEYRHGVRMLVGDVGAAVEAALEAGAAEVGIADWHYLGRNVPAAAFPDLPIRRLWRLGRPSIRIESLGRPDAAILVGVHAGAGNPEGFLSHTFWMGMSVLIDGVPVSEAVLWAIALGAEGVPVAAITGDSRAVEEAAGLLPEIPAVAVKAGTSRTSAILRPPQDARDEIAETVRDALGGVPEPLAHPFPANVTIRFAEAPHAARTAAKGVAERTGRRDVSARLGSAHDLMPFLARGLLATPMGRGPALANRLLPRGSGTFARLRSVCLDPILGWLERRVVHEWAREPAELYPVVGGRRPAARRPPTRRP